MTNERGDLKRSLLFGALAGLSLAVVFVAGFFFRDFLNIPQARALNTAVLQSGEGYPLLDEVQELVDRIYLREQPEYQNRQYAAIVGMLGSLKDPNTFFIEPVVAQSESQVLAGTYGGIGVQVVRIETGEFALFPFVDGPAFLADIKDGDILVAINGVEVDLTEKQDAIDQKLRGEVKEGSGVEISVRRGDEEVPYTTFIEFAVINVPSVVWRVTAEDARIGYVQVIRFSNRTPDELSAALDGLREAGIEGLIIDMRGNSGGLLQESVAAADEFLDGGVILYDRSRSDERIFEAQPGGKAADWPLVVLVNGSTASAAELVAGAIQERERGILIGQKTYGKGTVQQIVALSDGSSVHITSSEWLLPTKNHIDGVGLAPDIEMIPDENGRDVEMGEALRYLQRLLQGKSS